VNFPEMPLSQCVSQFTRDWRRLVFSSLLAALVVSQSLLLGLSSATVGSGGSSIPEIPLTQTAELRLAFMGITEEDLNVSRFSSDLAMTYNEFWAPRRIQWSLNVTQIFLTMPADLVAILEADTFLQEEDTYYNVTILDEYISNSATLDIPPAGILLVFMRFPEAVPEHSWFYVDVDPDLVLGRTDSVQGEEYRLWEVPLSFGGTHRVVYFDLSSFFRSGPSPEETSAEVISAIEACYVDLFPDLLGSQLDYMKEADMQTYEDYRIRILSLNGSASFIDSESLECSFEKLMPWTEWTVSIQEDDMNAELKELIDSRTIVYDEPLEYAWTYENGTKGSIVCYRSLYWSWHEYDALNSYFFDRVVELFSLQSAEDRSIIPVVFIHLDNDTALSGYAGVAGGACYFHRNVVIMIIPAHFPQNAGQVGRIWITDHLRHEIGHWLSLQHHSSQVPPQQRIICDMQTYSSGFCCFCKDARARMSFISYYQRACLLLENRTGEAGEYVDAMRAVVEDFRTWDYARGVSTLIRLISNMTKSGWSGWPSPSVTASIVIGTAALLACLVLLCTRERASGH
jgi:hypothetical protein